MQLYYLLVVIMTSDVKVTSSTVIVIFAITWVVNNYNIFAITWVVNNYNILTELHVLTEPNQTHAEPNPEFFQKTKQKPNSSKKYIPYIPSNRHQNERQRPGQTSLHVQNFSHIHSGISQEMRPEKTDRHTANLISPLPWGR